MSLDLVFSRDDRSVWTCSFFRLDYAPPYLNDEAAPWTVFYQDLLLQVLRGGYYYYPGGPRSLADIFGLLGYTPTHRVSVSRKPIVPLWTDRHDAHYYGSFYRNLQLFGSSLSGKAFTAPSPLGEHVVRHHNFSGSLTTEQALVQTYSEDYGLYENTIKVRNLHGQLIDRATLLSVTPFEFVLHQQNFPWLPTYNVLDILSYIRKEGLESFVFFLGSEVRRKITHLEWTLDGRGLRISYHMHVINHTIDNEYDWNSEVWVPLETPELLQAPSVGSLYFAPATTHSYFSYKGFRSRVIDPGRPYGRLEDVFNGGVSYNTTLPYSIPGTIDVTERDRMLSPKTRSTLEQVLDNFKHEVDAHHEWIVTSCLFSTVDAFQQAEGYLGTNILQNLAKLPDIAASLPQVKEAISVLGKILKRDLSLSTLKELTSLISSTNLQYNFQWRPYHSVATKYLPQMVSTFRTLGDISKHAIGYGSFSATRENVFGRDRVTFQTRTKIVMDTSSSGLLSAILGIDALGLLPKYSNIWDLIPFSFAANWFTGVGENIRRSEYSLLLATIPAYYCHTYAISSPLSPHELTYMKVSTHDDDRATLKLFYRDVSLYTPAPKDSPLGFGIPTKMPNSGVLGSLLYQLIIH